MKLNNNSNNNIDQENIIHFKNKEELFKLSFGELKEKIRSNGMVPNNKGKQELVDQLYDLLNKENEQYNINNLNNTINTNLNFNNSLFLPIAITYENNIFSIVGLDYLLKPFNSNALKVHKDILLNDDYNDDDDDSVKLIYSFLNKNYGIKIENIKLNDKVVVFFGGGFNNERRLFDLLCYFLDYKLGLVNKYVCNNYPNNIKLDEILNSNSNLKETLKLNCNVNYNNLDIGFERTAKLLLKGVNDMMKIKNHGENSDDDDDDASDYFESSDDSTLTDYDESQNGDDEDDDEDDDSDSNSYSDDDEDDYSYYFDDDEEDDDEEYDSDSDYNHFDDDDDDSNSYSYDSDDEY